MPIKIVWDATGVKTYETGIDRGVVYPQISDGSYPIGYAWNGLTAVTEKPSGAESTPKYADNIKYLNLVSVEEFKATIEAFTFPKEFALLDGTVAPLVGVYAGQQPRKTFGLSYRTIYGNDVLGDGYGYKIHLIWGCIASPSEKGYSTINDSPDVVSFSWDINTTPTVLTGYKPTSYMVVDSVLAVPAKLLALETALYGATPSTEGRLPTPDAVITLMT